MVIEYHVSAACCFYHRNFILSMSQHTCEMRRRGEQQLTIHHLVLRCVKLLGTRCTSYPCSP